MTVFPEKTVAQYGGVPWWIIVVAVLAGILMLALLVFLLWKVGPQRVPVWKKKKSICNDIEYILDVYFPNLWLDTGAHFSAGGYPNVHQCFR